MKISQLSKPRTLTVDFGEDGSLNVTYDPANMTAEMESTIMREEGEAFRTQHLIDALVFLVDEWDLEDDDEGSITGAPGSTIPLDKDVLKKVPIQALSAVMIAIGNDASSSAKEAGKDSAAT